MAEPASSASTPGDGDPDGDRADSRTEDRADPQNEDRADRPDDRADRPGDRTDPPGPTGLPLVGNTIEFLRDPVAFYERCGSYDSDVVKYSIGGDTGYMLTDPADIERVLVTDAADYGRASITQETLGQIADGGLFLLEGEEWSAHRTALQPAFYRDRIETYADMMVRFAAERADEWELTGHDSVVVSEEMRSLTLEVLAKTLLDVDIRDRESAIRDAAAVISERFDAGSLSAYLPLWVPTPANRRCKRAIEQFDDAIEEMVAERHASDDEFDDLLSILLSLDLNDDSPVESGNGSSLDAEQIRDHLFTFLFAGHETTALTLSYATFLLANHPEKQARLHEELDGVLDGQPTASDLFELDYLGNVVDEAMRLYPPAYTVFRESKRDVEIGGYRIPAGSLVSLPQWVVHRDERWYDDPDAFRPERWADDGEADAENDAADPDDAEAAVEEVDDRPEYAYFPFGGGPRHCIGMRFALMEAKLVLATLARRFRFEPVTEPPLDLSMQITLQPTEPVEVGLASR